MVFITTVTFDAFMRF